MKPLLQASWRVVRDRVEYGVDIQDEGRQVAVWTASRSDPGGTGSSCSWSSFLGGRYWDTITQNLGDAVLAHVVAVVRARSAPLPDAVSGEGAEIRWRWRLYEAFRREPLAAHGGDCPVCTELPESMRVDSMAGERLPAAVRKLWVAAAWGLPPSVLRYCPLCGAPYLEQVRYEFDFRGSEEEKTLRRISREEDAALREQLDLPAPSTRSAAEQIEAELADTPQSLVFELGLAARHGDVEWVDDCLARGASPVTPDPFGSTPMMQAVVHGHRAMVEHLCQQGAPLDPPLVLLRQAISAGAEEVFRLLVERGLLARAAGGEDQRGVLSAAVMGPSEPVAVEVLGAFSTLDPGFAVGPGTPLYWAARSGKARLLRALLERGADPDQSYGTTPLEVAVDMGRRSCIRALVRAGAAFDRRPEESLLGRAARSGRLTSVRTLLALGLDPNGRHASDCPLATASRQGFTAIVRALLDAGATVDGRNGAPLWMACREGHRPVVELLVSRGARTDGRDGQGRTPIEVARQYDHASVVAFLAAVDG